MKKILDRKTYNTDTAILVAESWSSHSDAGSMLYQTRHGAYFLFVQPPQNPADSYLKPLSDDEALKWLQAHAEHLIEQYFGHFPEAGAAERRWTVRIPENLARRVETIACGKGMPLNRYLMRCLERCVTADGQPRTDN
jgi:predicted DNA binding CopG/RHH family protein